VKALKYGNYGERLWGEILARVPFNASAATGGNTKPQQELESAWPQHQPRDCEALFSADAASLFVSIRTDYAFSWKEVPLDVSAQAGNVAPIHLVANLTMQAA